MKALYTAAPGEFGLVDRPRPTPGPGDAVIAVTRASICHTDVTIRSGRAGHVRYPVIPGHEFCGVIEEIGAAVPRLSPGQAVVVETVLACGLCPPCRRGHTNWCEAYDELGSISDGGFAQFCLVPARHLLPLPAGVSSTAAAMVEPLANAIAAVTQAGVGPGDRVMVIGPGPIGLLALQVARLRGAAVLLLAGTRDARLKLGSRLGATHVVNVLAPDADAQIGQVLEGKGADAIIECAGNPKAMSLALRHVGILGRIAVEGVYDVEEMVSFSPYRSLLQRSARLLGVSGWNSSNFIEALELLSRGRVDAESLVTHTFSLDDWEEAFAMATVRKDEAMKVQFDLSAT
ncbi:MAG: alcohol dehydrogenase catalytic domain-containing protein [Gemmatimonadota bacterium]